MPVGGGQAGGRPEGESELPEPSRRAAGAPPAGHRAGAACRAGAEPTGSFCWDPGCSAAPRPTCPAAAPSAVGGQLRPPPQGGLRAPQAGQQLDTEQPTAVPVRTGSPTPRARPPAAPREGSAGGAGPGAARLASPGSRNVACGPAWRSSPDASAEILTRFR